MKSRRLRYTAMNNVERLLKTADGYRNQHFGVFTQPVLKADIGNAATLGTFVSAFSKRA